MDAGDRIIAEILRNEGYQVKKLRVSNIEGQRTPDFEVIDPSNPQIGIRTVEAKQPKLNRARTILEEISESLRTPPQSPNIIVDGTVAGVTREVALEVFRLVLTRLDSGRRARLNSLRIIGNDFDISTKYPDVCF